MLARLRALFAKELVLVLAVVAALVSCAFVPFDDHYAAYVDWSTLGLLWCLMTVVTGLRFLGVMRLLGEWMVAHAHSRQALVAVLVGLAFFCSMLLTNDVSLITFVPFALVVLHAARLESLVIPVVVLMTIAANLGSMLLPMGNPQNLYLYQASGISFGSFVGLMAPYTLASAAFLALGIAFVFRRRRPGDSLRAAAAASCAPTERKALSQADKVRAVAYAALFVVAVLAVLSLCPVEVALGITLVVVLVMDRKVLGRVDYGLLLTFVALFVFVGNLGRLSVVYEALSCLVNAAPVLAAVAASQVISNVPAALLLSGFTDNYPALIVGTNLGGLGTLIASMASLISFKLACVGNLANKRDYLVQFSVWNGAFLVALLLLHGALSLAEVL